MNFSNVENLINEFAMTKNDREYQNGDSYTFATRTLMGYLSKKKDIEIRLPLTKIDGSVYLVRKYKHEELLPLIETAAFSDDFVERNKAQKQLRQKLAPLYRQLINDLYDECSARAKPKVTKDRNENFIVEYKSETGKPYIKFQSDKQKKKWYLISYHDLENVLKKKSYNDNSSYKFGSREVKAKIRQELENSKLEQRGDQ